MWLYITSFVIISTDKLIIQDIYLTIVDIEIDYAMAYTIVGIIYQYEDRIFLGTFLICKTGHSGLTNDTKAAYDPCIVQYEHERELCIYIYYICMS